MAQQPNVGIGPADRPTQHLQPPPADSWRPDRPGDPVGASHPEGPEFGRPGPNTGYALKLVRFAGLPEGPRADELEAVVGTLAGARAALFGRAPVMVDVEVALALLGLGVDEDTEALARRRAAILDGAAHDHVKGWGFVASLPETALSGDVEAARVYAAGSLSHP